MGLQSSLLKFDASGRIRWTQSAPTEYNGGTPTIQGLWSIADAVAVNYNAGMGYTATGFSCIDTGSPVTAWLGGIPMAGFGRMAVDTAAAFSHHAAGGIPITVNGRVALAASPEVPALISGFSNGFSNGFGA